MTSRGRESTKQLGWIHRRVVSVYDVVNASYLPTTINIYDLEIRSINNYRRPKSYDIASFLVSPKISRRCRFGNSKPCKYIRSSYVRRNCKRFLLRLSLISLVNGQHPTPANSKQYNAAQPDVSCKTTIDMPASQPCSSTLTYLHYNNAAAIPKTSCYTESDTN